MPVQVPAAIVATSPSQSREFPKLYTAAEGNSDSQRLVLHPNREKDPHERFLS